MSKPMWKYICRLAPDQSTESTGSGQMKVTPVLSHFVPDPRIEKQIAQGEG